MMSTCGSIYRTPQTNIFMRHFFLPLLRTTFSVHTTAKESRRVFAVAYSSEKYALYMVIHTILLTQYIITFLCVYSRLPSQPRGV